MKMTIFRMLFGAVIVAVFGLSVAGQTPDKPTPVPPAPAQPSANQPPAVAPCPALSVKSAVQQQQFVREGAELGFVANVAGGDTKIAPTFTWSITSGIIKGGQGTRNISVDTAGSGADRAVTASVMVGGFAPECEYMAEATVKIAGPARKVHEYGTADDEQQEKWLDSLTAAMGPDEQAWVIVYAGRSSIRGAAFAELKKIRAHVLKNGTPGDRIVTIDGGYREETAHEFFLVPTGAEQPRATPTISARDIVFPKPVKGAKKPGE